MGECGGCASNSNRVQSSGGAPGQESSREQSPLKLNAFQILANGKRKFGSFGGFLDRPISLLFRGCIVDVRRSLKTDTKNYSTSDLIPNFIRLMEAAVNDNCMSMGGAAAWLGGPQCIWPLAPPIIGLYVC